MIRYIFVLSVAVSVLWGCGDKEKAVEYYPIYQQVSVPVYCAVSLPEKPSYEGITVKDNLNILVYAESLESALKACIKE